MADANQSGDGRRSGADPESERRPVSGPPAAETQDLLLRSKHGDVEADRELFERHRPLLVSYVHRHRLRGALREPWETEDVVDEAFLRVLRSGFLREFEDPEPQSLRHALKRVAERVLIDELRRQGAAIRDRSRLVNDQGTASSLAEALAALTSGNPSPTSNAREAELVEFCQESLDEREWEAWRLTQVLGLTSDEAGVQLGIGGAAVRGLVYRARIRLVRAYAAKFRTEEGDGVGGG